MIMKRFLLLFCLLFVPCLAAQAETYRVEDIPNVQRADRTRYVSNPDGILSDVAVAREVDGVRTIEYLDLTSKDLFNSPAFYIQQNDVIYVKPNKYKAQAGEISQNRNFYLSLVGTAISVATLIITLTK